MTLFHPENRTRSSRHARVWAAYEIAYTFVDFSAAGLFVVGSILFLSPATTYAATWLFIVGSVFFGLKPTIRLIRELKLVSLGEDDQVARRLDG
ncbi:MAG: YrhK family protein [Rhodobacter sp.]|uniref:YrhK family protein n=1 Tax=Pararhodobacter sp. TaxID=2127056 RepID=UPI002CEBF479|nr:YrhK family protein [Pararhodobacter sp.]MCC0073712.1 YrhK family protein [Rhodobacter sp.]HPD93144.1 YrhK family protein [Pararhodobacter sp.]